MTKILSLLVLVLFILMPMVFAKTDQHHQMDFFEKVEHFQDSIVNAYNLQKLKKFALNGSVEPQIAYEKLYQSQREISIALGEFAPVDVALFGSMLVTGAWSIWGTLYVGKLVVAIPSKWFHYKEAKELAYAEWHIYKAIQENIKNQVARLYYAILTQDVFLKTYLLEQKLLGELLPIMERKLKDGVIVNNRFRELYKNQFELSDYIFKLKGLIEKEKSIMAGLLGYQYHGQSLEFMHVKSKIDMDSILTDIKKLAEHAVNRSYEIKSSTHTILAAQNAKKSVIWSILNFDGIGFEYGATIKIAKSRLNELIEKRRMLKSTIKKQIYFKYQNLFDHLKFRKNAKLIERSSKMEVVRSYELFIAGKLKQEELLAAKILYLEDFRSLISNHYKSWCSLDDLNRLLLGDILKI